jgi:hypothetical protein
MELKMKIHEMATGEDTYYTVEDLRSVLTGVDRMPWISATN